MNALSNLSDFALNTVLKEISEVQKEHPKNKEISIEIPCSMDDDNDLRNHKRVLNFLEENEIISELKNRGEQGYLEDENSQDVDMYFYTPSFILNHEKFERFLIDTSRLPVYTLKRDSTRRIIINDKFVLTKTHLDRSNDYFAEYIFNSPSEVIKREDIKEKSKEMSKRFHAILEDLKITPELRAIFFPSVGKNTLIFRKNVMKKDLENLNIDEKSLTKFLNSLQRI